MAMPLIAFQALVVDQLSMQRPSRAHIVANRWLAYSKLSLLLHYPKTTCIFFGPHRRSVRKLFKAGQPIVLKSDKWVCLFAGSIPPPPKTNPPERKTKNTNCGEPPPERNRTGFPCGFLQKDTNTGTRFSWP